MLDYSSLPSPVVKLLHCDGICDASVTTPWSTQTALRASPRFAVDHVLAAFSSQGLAISHDGGATYSVRPVPMGASQLSDLELSQVGGSVVLVALLAGAPGGSGPEIALSRDLGASWQLANLTALGKDSVRMIRALGGLNLIASVSTPDTANRFGFACSSNGGAGWGRC